jgi:hypothetical protein
MSGSRYSPRQSSACRGQRRSDPLGQETPSETLTRFPRPATLKLFGSLMMTARNTKGETNGYT